MRPVVFLAALLLAACGTSDPDRVQGGAATGAATGAGIGIIGGPIGVLVGGIIGGGAGAITAVTTTPDQLNLGKPVWDNPEIRTPITNNSGSSAADGPPPVASGAPPQVAGSGTAPVSRSDLPPPT